MHAPIFLFEYALKNKAGLYYNGNAYGDHRDWTSRENEAYTYTEKGAYRKKDLFPAYFGDCVVEKIV